MVLYPYSCAAYSTAHPPRDQPEGGVQGEAAACGEVERVGVWWDEAGALYEDARAVGRATEL